MPDAQGLKNEVTKKIDDFLDYMAVEKGSSPLTIRNYKHYLSRLNNFLMTKGKNSLNSINLDLVHDFRIYLTKLGLGRKTQGYHAIALRSFLKE
jgi:site-specific recombinase XerC